ncbi:acyl-CoA dehydrogenase [Nocardia sp. ET3-3]|uniref:Acyl-CoA dehydrogenase n=1 Tax=Nocardia terrae TaxID=2675851 RepID=A0A7K1UV97_9NOCA|nr:acyl-CoA dehydrogenase family protein [Nocardia terrae]MVU78294.1 acyl-CoA dehydrogenase [Nocardia terrae]
MDTHETELRQRVRDLCATWDYTPRCDSWAGGFEPEFSRELARRGLLARTWPKHLGGAEDSNVARLAITEELLRAGAPVSAHWVGERQIGPELIRLGTPELQEEFCPRLASAEYVFALGMSEPDAGSDLAAVRTTAVRDGDGWRLTGRKIWTSGAHRATHLYVLARTARTDDKHAGLTEFIVERTAPGVTVRPIIGMDGEHHFNEVTFDEVFTPDRWVIGQVGDGWSQVVGQLSFERGGPERFLSMYPLLKAVLDADGLLGAEDARRLRSLLARLMVLRTWARETALALDAGRSPIVEAATSKYLGNRFELDCIEFVRGLLPRCDADIHRMYSQAVLAGPKSGIRGGAAPVMLSIIAKGAK